MKKLFLLLACGLLAQPLLAQTEAEMKAWQAYMTPGDMHQKLAATAGDFKYETTMWMLPGAEPIKSQGSARNEMVMGGRYLRSTFTGEFMGMPWEGISTTAYDNAKKKFVATWVDNLGTGIMLGEGKWNPQANAIEFTGTQTDPMTGKDMKFRERFTIRPDGTQLMEMWLEHEGKEFKSMEIRFTKV